jgi:hypothetical protein
MITKTHAHVSRVTHRVGWVAATMAAVLLAAPAGAQWRNLPTAGIPLDASGRPDLSAPTPRDGNGRVDLSGIYSSDIRYFRNLAADLGLENVPMTPEARRIRESREGGLLSYLEPDSRCLPQGVPKINMAPVPFKIVQTDTLVVLVYEAFTLWRQVFLDDREFADDLNPAWLGYSKGRWEGDELVVETRGLNGKQWLDNGGLPTSDKLTVIERFRRPTFGQLEIDVTIDDPTYYTRPWTVTTKARRMLGTELLEFICPENEKSTPHMGPHIQ